MVSVIRRQLLQICLVGIILTSVTGSAIQPRLINGQPVDTLRRFPHHVTINRIIKNYVQGNQCSGSIIAEQWILTSALCVVDCDGLIVNFQKQHLNSNKNSFAAMMNKDAIRVYPTDYDDIALVKIPFRLVFSDLVRPVNISAADISSLEGVLTVLPGFDVQPQVSTTPWPTMETTSWMTTDQSTETPSKSTAWSTTEIPSKSTAWSTTEISSESTSWPTADTTSTTEQSTETSTEPTSWPTTGTIPTLWKDLPEPSAQLRTSSDQLSYGMFKVLSNSKCKGSNNEFDEYMQLCTESWNIGIHSPCVSDYGAGLIAGWPSRPELVGIYTVLLNNCNPSAPAIYTNVAKYYWWIKNIVNG